MRWGYVCAMCLAVAATGVASADTIYRDSFNNTTDQDASNFKALSVDGWNAVFGASATPVSNSKTAGFQGALSNGNAYQDAVNKPANIGTTAPNTGYNKQGYAFLLNNDTVTNGTNIDAFLYTNQAAPIAQSGNPVFAFIANPSSITVSYRLAIEIGTNWYVAATPYSPPINTGWTTAQQDVVTFDPTGTNWKALSFTTNSVLSTTSDLNSASTVGGMLPAGDIVGFGVYCNLPSATANRARVDFFTVDTTVTPPVPLPSAVWAGAGLLGLVGIARRRKA